MSESILSDGDCTYCMQAVVSFFFIVKGLSYIFDFCMFGTFDVFTQQAI